MCMEPWSLLTLANSAFGTQNGLPKHRSEGTGECIYDPIPGDSFEWNYSCFLQLSRKIEGRVSPGTWEVGGFEDWEGG